MDRDVAGKSTGRVEKTDAEWRDELSPEAYRVTRQGGTEPPFSHETFPKSPGVFRCVCCGQPLFEQSAKFESGSGWPSFTQPLADGAIAEREDRSLGTRRTEVLCSRCGAHLGHVFPDGPQPTRLRYCINGVALEFEPRE